MSAAVNSIIGAQSDSIARGTGGPEFGEESDSLESWAVRSAGLAFGSIAFDVQPFILEERSGLRVRDRGWSVCGLQGTIRRQSRIMPLEIVRRAWKWLEPVEDQVSAGICR